MRVDFYITDDAPLARLQLACRILAKAYQKQHHCFVNAASQQSAAQLNDLLWTYQDTSFVPHHLAGELTPGAPIQIGFQQNSSCQDILLNLGEIPSYHTQFQRIIEIVGGSDEEKTQARQRYRFYQQQGYDLNTHQIAAR